MPEVTAHAPGFPSWAELSSPDVAASNAFYCELFGWYVYTMENVFGDYHVFTLGGVEGPAVAGMQPLVDDSAKPSWTCYFRSDDIPATLDTVRAMGGRELLEPTDVNNLGRMALCGDPEGADFALWEPYDFPGAEVVDEPSAMCWVELATHDIDGARRFYNAVFGWRSVDRSYYEPAYTNWKIGDWSVAGMLPLESWWPVGFPPHWIPYFWVLDCDATAARAAELGAVVHVPPTDIKPGRLSVLTDPAGARLAVLTPAVDDRAAVRSRP
ncbi:VOC family protein [Actinomadura darangshiensis]|uniref:VOC family protein n=1 Tax=Actinomadura darangshiensis TaxID=705336 RepID=A0A4V2YY78_9ACTN|nr:VOC family protein [Actinomadura darangshiensis]TDD92147.1 VOC family protein [Actinomadura darangshiensis]